MSRNCIQRCVHPPLNELIISQRMKTKIPIQLKLVAWIFILSGISAAIEILIDSSKGLINWNFGILGVFIGIGLLRLRNGWRALALILLVITLVFIPVLSVLALSTPGRLNFSVFGQKVAILSPPLFFTLLVGYFVLTFWQFHVLIQPRNRVMFLNRKN
jgi:hypothetical protein